VRSAYWRRYGATLLGMVAHHGVDPHEFLRETHPFPDLHQIVRRDRRLHAALARLPGRRLIVTNAPHDYARRVVQLLGIAALIEGIVPVETMRFAGRLQPKPSRAMLRRIVARVRAHPSRCVMVEDTIANLNSARALGITTVLVTGITHGSRPAAARPRAGSARRIGIQVQSFDHLPRRALPRRSNV
jgi:putative hydrolase of the HAD superfamily